MPFAYDLLDQELQKKKDDAQGGGGPEGAAPAMTGGGQSFGDDSSQFNQPSQQKGTNNQGSGFVGLDKYMAANKGSNFGTQVTGKVQGSVDQAKQGLAQGAQDFTNASNQGGVKWNDVQNDVKGVIDNAGDQTSKADADKIKNYASSTYQGPETFYGSAYGSKALGDAQKASQQANALQSEGGRFALLDQFYGRPNYSMGEKSLDNLLVQNQPGTAARAQSIGGQAKGLTSDVNHKAQDLDNLAAVNRQSAADTAKQTQDYLNNSIQGFEGDLDKRYQDYQTGNNDYNQARVSDLGDDALDADTMGLYGLNEGTSLYDTDLSNYLQQSQNASKGQFASDSDYAKYLALSQLAGSDPSYLMPDDRSGAGSGATMGKVSVDKDRLSQDLASRKSTYDSSAQPIQQSISQTQSQLAAAQDAFNRHYASLPVADSVTGDSGQKMENTTTRQLRSVVQQLQGQLNDYQSQFNTLNGYMHPDRKVGKQ